MTKNTAKSAPGTLHRKIQSDLERMICSGRWPPGSRLPIERELMEKYDCSRMTVNKVLSSLAKRGMIERWRRAGSFVAAPTHHTAVLEIPDIQSDIVSRGRAYRYALLSSRQRAARAGQQDELDLAGGGMLLELRCVHYEDERPFAFEERLISLVTVPDAAATDFSAIAPGTWLLSHVAWSEAEHTITAIAASPVLAQRLSVPARSPCLCLRRRTWKHGKPVTHVRLVFPGDRHSLTAQFRPSEV